METIINIHNPTDKSVDFNTKMAIQEPLHLGGDAKVTTKDARTLGANLGFSFDCIDIVAELDADGAITVTDFDLEEIVEGWVIIEAARSTLAVCANYNKHVFFEDSYFVAGTENTTPTVDFDVGTTVTIPNVGATDPLAAAGGMGVGGGASVSVVCYQPIKVKGKFVQ